MTKAKSIASVIKRLKRAHIDFDRVVHSCDGRTVRFITESGRLVAIFRKKKDKVFPVKREVREYTA